VALRWIGAVGLVTVLALAGGALAQDFSVTVTPPEEAVSVDEGGSATASVDVTLQGQDFYCVQETELPVEISTSGGSGVSGTPGSSNLTFVVAGQIYNPDTTGEYNETQSVDVNLEASPSAGGSSSQVSLSANFPGGEYTECGPESFPAAEDSAPIDVAVQGSGATDGGGTDGGGADDGTGGEDDGGEDGSGVPGPGVAALVGALSVAAAARSRS
jgi:hypothetical protein